MVSSGFQIRRRYRDRFSRTRCTGIHMGHPQGPEHAGRRPGRQHPHPRSSFSRRDRKLRTVGFTVTLCWERWSASCFAACRLAAFSARLWQLSCVGGREAAILASASLGHCGMIRPARSNQANQKLEHQDVAFPPACPDSPTTPASSRRARPSIRHARRPGEPRQLQHAPTGAQSHPDATCPFR